MNVISLDINAQSWKIEDQEGAIMDSDKVEHIKDAVAMMGQYCDILGVRTFANLTKQSDDYNELILKQFQEYAAVPVVSLESAIRHPLQSLADWITIEENKKTDRPKVVLSWTPHPKALPQAVANSFVEWMQIADYDLVITHPKGYELSETFTKDTKIEYDQNKALEGADFVYAKNWSSFQSYGQILSQDQAWMITDDKLNLTNEGKLMHCLPVRRNVEVSDSVLDGKYSLTLAQAKNREYAAQAVFLEIFEQNLYSSRF